MSKTLILAIFPFLLMQTSCAFGKKSNISFNEWKKDFISRSAKKGLPASFLKKELDGISFNKKIIKRDRNQITSSKTTNYEDWIKRWLGSNSRRISKGKNLLKKYDSLLTQIEKKYGVDKEVIVSLWGVETMYGEVMGNYEIIPALVTLSYDKRRRSFFEKELFSALKIVYEGHVSRAKLKGSWAGATGQCQFMLSSFLMYAQDFDGDGRKDIWSNPADIFASIANYLKRSRWKKGQSIGQLTIPTKKNGREIAQIKKNPSENVALIPHKNSPVVYKGKNYRTIMRWNKSSLFAALNIILMDAFSTK